MNRRHSKRKFVVEVIEYPFSLTSLQTLLPTISCSVPRGIVQKAQNQTPFPPEKLSRPQFRPATNTLYPPHSIERTRNGPLGADPLARCLASDLDYTEVMHAACNLFRVQNTATVDHLFVAPEETAHPPIIDKD